MNIDIYSHRMQLLAERLKWCRRMKKKSLREVERDTWISNTYLSQLENGVVKNPGIFTINILADYYGVSVGDLIDEAPRPRRRQSKCKHDILYAEGEQK